MFAAAGLVAGATVYEMPTAPAVGGGTTSTATRSGACSTGSGRASADITRVVVVNGSGAPGLGTLIDGRLAPVRVLGRDLGERFTLQRQANQIVASGDENVAAATQAQKVLGVGTVKVSDQPTSLSDVTIIVGKDFSN